MLTGARAVRGAKTFARPPVVYVLGNREASGCNIEEVLREIAEARAATSDVHFLNCGNSGAGIHFLGVKLRTDFCLFGDDARLKCMRAAEEMMSDWPQGYWHLKLFPSSPDVLQVIA